MSDKTYTQSQLDKAVNNAVNKAKADAEATQKTAVEEAVNKAKSDAQATQKIAVEEAVNKAKADAEATQKTAIEEAVNQAKTDLDKANKSLKQFEKDLEERDETILALNEQLSVAEKTKQKGTFTEIDGETYRITCEKSTLRIDNKVVQITAKDIASKNQKEKKALLKSNPGLFELLTNKED